MKHLYYSNLTLLLLVSAISLSSCRDWEDTSQSMALSGEWHGDFGMYYNYVDRFGREYTFDSYDSYLTFIPAYSYATYGRGTQVDYYEWGPYEYQYYRFSWSVEGGGIYLRYDYDHDLDAYISNYRMTNTVLSGTFPSGTRFNLHKLTDYYDWTPYVNVYGYGDRPNWGSYYPYYAPSTRSDSTSAGATPSDSPSADAAPTDSLSASGRILSRGRRQ